MSGKTTGLIVQYSHIAICSPSTVAYVDSLVRGKTLGLEYRSKDTLMATRWTKEGRWHNVAIVVNQVELPSYTVEESAAAVYVCVSPSFFCIPLWGMQVKAGPNVTEVGE
jgi:hypothetical protein